MNGVGLIHGTEGQYRVAQERCFGDIVVHGKLLS